MSGDVKNSHEGNGLIRTLSARCPICGDKAIVRSSSLSGKDLKLFCSPSQSP